MTASFLEHKGAPRRWCTAVWHGLGTRGQRIFWRTLQSSTDFHTTPSSTLPTCSWRCSPRFPAQRGPRLAESRDWQKSAGLRRTSECTAVRARDFI